ncbi:hypothetical protein Pta02_12500 [Planobispora takensis]|uniref:DUF397 domain-containing protein n=2 Tax=Planobispora takensis TaxID=1367882 RepID=A0A8J3WTU2_9ACTN|nr:hypothetical protein Pta02_12500 [Planobispora takensis]
MTLMDPSRVTWRKSSRSTDGGDCVEVAVVPGGPAASEPGSASGGLYLVRDSKDPDGPALTFTSDEWDAFVTGVKRGEFG